jgi:coenzyme F420-0:L-glutamate ligase / coenzyme F420-1:gamma-L-glutamate ligase
VLAALLAAVGHPERYEAVVRLDDREELLAAITDGVQLTDSARQLMSRMIAAAQPLW